MLRPGSPWRTGINRALALGPSRLALGLAIVLVLVSLALPFWSLSEAMGTDQNISSFSWTVAIPGAATEDVGAFTIGNFWGSASTSAPPTGWSWGPGLGWWVLLLAVILGAAGAVFPYVKSVRAMIPSPPPGWRPSS